MGLRRAFIQPDKFYARKCQSNKCWFINYYISKSLNLGVSILKFLFILPSPSSYIS